MTGESLLHYEILDKIGQGGMGVVYLARDTRLERMVALKVIPPEQSSDPKRKQRFLREARSAAALNHPNIVGLYEIGADRGIDFIAMEFVPGESLQSAMSRGRLPLAEIVSYSSQIAAALAKAHSAGVVHRDLKPGNVMIAPEGQVKLLDFGLAQLSRHQTPSQSDSQNTETLSEITELGSVQGTVSYMSPEQARGEAVDHRSDIFSFGVMLYEMLGGVRPFQANNTVGILHAIVFQQATPVESLREETPPALLAVLKQCLEKDRERRAQSMDAILAGLRHVDDPGSASATAANAAAVKSYPWWRYAAVAAGGFAIAAGAWTVAHHAAAGGYSDAPELVRQGQAYLFRYDKKGNKERALEAFQRAVAQDRSSAAAYAGLGDAYSFQHASNPDPQLVHLARTNASRAIELNPLLSAAHESMGAVMIEEGKAKDAEVELRRALELDPSNAAAQLNLGDALTRQLRWKDAEEVYRKLIASHPDDWRGYHFLGSLLLRSTRYQEASAAIEKAAARVQDNGAVYRLLGTSYQKQGRDSEAAAAFQKSLAVRPTGTCYSALGALYFYGGRYEDALKAFQGAVSLSANDRTNWNNLGDAYRYTPGNEAKAKEAYQEAIRLAGESLKKSPGDQELRSNLIEYLAKGGQKERARTELRSLGAPTNLDPASLYTLGVASEFLGDRPGAIRYIAQAARAGYSISEMNADPDLGALRQDARYHLEVLAKASAGKK